MTDLERLAARLWQLLSKEADDFPLDRITRSSRLARDLNLSGVQRISLAYRLEAEFEVQFTDGDYDAIVHLNATVSDVLAAVSRNVSTTKETAA